MKDAALALSLVLSLLGCTTAKLADQAQDTTDEATVRLLEEQERVGVLNRDTAVLQRVWSEQLIVNAPSNQISSDREVVLNLVRQGLIHYSSFERRIERLRIDGDIALVMGGETIQPIGNAPQTGQVVQRRFTHVWKKEGNTWRLVARHANTIPS
jgi:ketosteroid isomerase-like protein